MNAKKLIAGILAGTMVLGTASVATFAADYVAKQKVGEAPAYDTEYTLDVLAEACKWWDPNTFSNALKLSDHAVTVTFDTTNSNVAYPWTYCYVYSSTTGAIYGGNPNDESYQAGKAAKMKEYGAIRGDAFAFSPNGATGWSDGVITYANLGSGYEMNLIGELPSTWVDDWTADIKSNGAKGTIVAYKDDKNAYIDYTYNGVETLTTIPLDSNYKDTYICLAADSSGVANVKYSYSAIAESSVKTSVNKTSFTYNGKVQKPTVKVTDEKGKAIAASNYTIAYSDKNSKKAGSYTITITFKNAYSKLRPRTYNYTINKAKQKLTLAKTSVSLKASAVKKKAKTYKMYVKGNSTGLSVSSSDKKVTVKKAKKSSKKGYTQYNITVKKGTKKGTYIISMYAKSNANYLQSGVKKFKVKVTK